MSEIWKSVVGFEGLYDVSNYGGVRSVNWRGHGYRQLVPVRDRYGYLKVCLTKDKRQYNRTVHRLVAMAFLGNPKDKPQVNHIDENKNNNRVENLEWSTSLENNNYGTRNRRVSSSKRNTNCTSVVQMDLSGSPIQTWVSFNEIERQLGFDTGLLTRVCKGFGSTAYGFRWQYAV